MDQKTYTPEEVRLLRHQGYSLKQLAEETGIDKASLVQMLNETTPPLPDESQMTEQEKISAIYHDLEAACSFRKIESKYHGNTLQAYHAVEDTIQKMSKKDLAFFGKKPTVFEYLKYTGAIFFERERAQAAAKEKEQVQNDPFLNRVIDLLVSKYNRDWNRVYILFTDIRDLVFFNAPIPDTEPEKEFWMEVRASFGKKPPKVKFFIHRFLRLYNKVEDETQLSDEQILDAVLSHSMSRLLFIHGVDEDEDWDEDEEEY